MSKAYLGIDPGAGGALGLILSFKESGLKSRVGVFDFKDGGVLVLLQNLFLEDEVYALIERQWARPKFRPIDSLLISFGTWVGRFEALNIPFEFVTAKKWQNFIFSSRPKLWKSVKAGMVTRKVLDTKAMSLEAARHLFPDLRDQLTRQKDADRADAILIAEYARRMDLGIK